MVELATGRRVSIRLLRPQDQTEFLAAVAQSLELHAGWVSAPQTAQQFTDLLARLAEPQNHGFLVLDRASSEMVGLINLTNAVMGRWRSANLGYYAFSNGAGRGLMGEALLVVSRYAFDALDLHRLEAGIQPTNDRSLQLVRSAGFRYEGLSLRYLLIDGQWRDHERWAITEEDLA